MSAHVTVELRHDPGGPPIRRLQPAGAHVGDLLPRFDDLAFPLLRLVDPYGETIFSAYQMSVVLPELELLYSRTNEPILRQTISLAEECRRTPGSCLAFLGD